MLTLRELVEAAFEMGYQAAERGESRAPALNEDFMKMMQENMVTDWTEPLQAYVRGHQTRTDKPDQEA